MCVWGSAAIDTAFGPARDPQGTLYCFYGWHQPLGEEWGPCKPGHEVWQREKSSPPFSLSLGLWGRSP